MEIALNWMLSNFDDSHSLGLKSKLEDYYSKEVFHGCLYLNLDTLVDKGSSGRASPILQTDLLHADGLEMAGDQSVW